MALLSIAVLGAGLYWGRQLSTSSLTADYEKLFNVKESEPIDLSAVGETTWVIPSSDWSYQGEGRLALVVPRDQMEKGELISGPTNLKFNVTVTARLNHSPGTQANRKIQDWYFQDTDVQQVGNGLWKTSGSAGIEYGIAGFHRSHYEDTLVHFTVLQPAARGGHLYAHLKALTDADYALAGHAPLFFLIMDAATVLCAIALLCLGFLASFPRKSP